MKRNLKRGKGLKKDMAYIIAEVGGNHDGSVDSAMEHIIAAKEAGADAVKFQIYKADKLVTPHVPAFKQAKGYRYQIDRFRDLELSQDNWDAVVGECVFQGIDFMATCFDIETLERYEPYMSYIKIASGDITYKALIEKAASYGKPVILSTGMATFDEIQEASKWVPQHLLTVLHCISTYPCPDMQVGINRITHLKNFYKRVGYSDHAMGITACLAAVSLGAKVIEKHFSLDNTKDFGDHPHSANPKELKELVDQAKRISQMFVNDTTIRPELDTNRFRRGGYAARDMVKGDVVTVDDITSLRPANLLLPHEYIGQTLTKDLKKGDSLG